MKIQPAFLLKNLWNIFRIDRGKYILKQIRKSDDKVAVAFNKELSDFFVFRMGRDPGFVQEVRTRINKDPTIEQRLHFYLLPLFAHHIEGYYEQLFDFTGEEINKTLSNLKKLGERKFSKKSEISQKYNNEESQNQELLEYLNIRYNEAIDLHDVDEIASILYHIKMFDIIKQTAPKNTKEHIRFGNEVLYSGFDRFKEIDNVAQRCLIEELPFFSLFYENKKNTDCVFIEIIPYNEKSYRSYIGILAFFLTDDSDALFDQLGPGWPLFRSISLIEAELWFWTLSPIEKISLLKGIYPFELSAQLLNGWQIKDDFFESISFYELLNIGQHFVMENNFEDAEIILKFLLNTTADPELKNLCSLSLELCFKKWNDYKSLEASHEHTIIKAESAFNSFQFEKAYMLYKLADSQKSSEIYSYNASQCLFQMGKLSEAVLEIAPLTKLDLPVWFLCDCYAHYGSMLILLGDTEKGLDKIEDGINLSFKQDNGQKRGTERILQTCIPRIISLKNPTQNHEIFKEISEGISQNIGPVLAENVIGLAFSEMYGSPEALYHFNRALELNLTQKDHGNILANKGALYFDMGKYDEAIETLEESLKYVDNNVNSYFNLASSYQKTGDFLNADKYMRKAADLKPENNKYSTFLEIYARLKTDRINRPSNLDTEVYEIWNFTDEKVLKLQNNPLSSKFIFREMAEGYCTGLELLLRKEVAKNIWERILKPNRDSLENLGYLPFVLHKILVSKNEFNITLGQWAKFREELEENKFRNNRTVREVRKYLKSRFKNEFYRICEVCSILSEPREKAVHPKEIASSSDFYSKRKDIVHLLNLIIGILYEK